MDNLPSVSLIGVLASFTLLAGGCSVIGKSTSEQLLFHKIQCAQEAREYWKVKAAYWGAGNDAADYGITSHDEWYTFSPKLNTCVLFELQYLNRDNKTTVRQYFIDVLTGAEIHGLNWLDLFKEANVDTEGVPKPKL